MIIKFKHDQLFKRYRLIAAICIGLVLLLYMLHYGNNHYDHKTSRAATEERVEDKYRMGMSRYPSLLSSNTAVIPEFDPRGYIMFCPCTGSVGNQVDQLLGSIAFAKKINRTLVVPHLISVTTNTHFKDWFRLEPLLDYHRVILADDFMKHIAPIYWPLGRRTGYCINLFIMGIRCITKSRSTDQISYKFWTSLDVDFDSDVPYPMSFEEDKRVWDNTFPAVEHPVLALHGAPGSYPIKAEHRELQRLMVFSDQIQDRANAYIKTTFLGQKFVGIHLRIGTDWVPTCKEAMKRPTYMSSPQCLDRNEPITSEMCLPSTEEIIRLSTEAVVSTGAKMIYVATDRSPVTREFKNMLQRELEVEVYNTKPKNGSQDAVDLAILTMSDHFIGNCVSPFTAFVKRARDVGGKPSSFWGF